MASNSSQILRLNQNLASFFDTCSGEVLSLDEKNYCNDLMDKIIKLRNVDGEKIKPQLNFTQQSDKNVSDGTLHFNLRSPNNSFFQDQKMKSVFKNSSNTAQSLEYSGNDSAFIPTTQTAKSILNAINGTSFKDSNDSFSSQLSTSSVENVSSEIFIDPIALQEKNSHEYGKATNITKRFSQDLPEFDFDVEMAHVATQPHPSVLSVPERLLPKFNF